MAGSALLMKRRYYLKPEIGVERLEYKSGHKGKRQVCIKETQATGSSASSA